MAASGRSQIYASRPSPARIRPRYDTKLETPLAELEDRRFVGSSEAIKKHSATLAVYQKSRPARWVNGVRQDVPINHSTLSSRVERKMSMSSTTSRTYLLIKFTDERES